LGDGPGKTADEMARELDADAEDVFHVLRHLSANDPAIKVSGDETPSSQKFSRGP
jgi:hypothetical protein